MEDGGEGNKAREQERGSRSRCVNEWAEAGWRLGWLIYLGLFEWLIDLAAWETERDWRKKDRGPQY